MWSDAVMGARPNGVSDFETTMPSGAYMWYLVDARPDIVRQYIVTTHNMAPRLGDFYLSVLECPVCITFLTGFWRE